MSAPSTPPPPSSGAGAPVPGLPMPGSAAVLPKSDYDRRVSPSPVQLNYLLPSQSEIHLIWNHKMYNTSKSSEVENWTRLVTDILEDLRRKQEAWGQPNFRGRRRRVENDMPFGAQNSSIPLIIGTSNAAGGSNINPSTSASQITTTTITLPNSVSGVAGDGAVPPPPPGDASSSANGDTILISPNAPPMPVPSSHSGSGPSSSTTTIHVVSSNASGAGSTTTSVPLVITTSTPLGGGMASASSALSNRDVSCDNKECDHNIPFMIACSSTVFTGDVDIAEVVSAESWRKQPYWNGRPHLPHNRTTKLHVVVKENKRRLEYTLHVNLSSTTGVNGKRRDTRAKCIILPLPDLRDSQKRPIYAVMQPPPFRARGSVYMTMEGWARLDLLRSNAEFEVFIFNNEENLPITVELGWCGRNPTTYPVDAARRKRKRERTKGMGMAASAPVPQGFDAAAWRSMIATFAPALAAAAAGSTPAGVTSPTLSGKTGEEKTAGGKKRKGAAAAAAAAAANSGGIMIRPFQWPVDSNAPESERKTNILSMVAGSFLTNAAGGQGLPIMKLENGVPVPVGLAFSPPGARAAGTDASGDSSAAGASSSSDASGATSVVGVTSSTDGVAADGSAAAAAGTNAQQQFVLIPFPASGAAGFPTIFPFPQMFPVNSQGKISMIMPGAGTDGSVVSAEAGAAGDQGDEKEAKSPTLKGKKKGGRKGKGAKRARKTRRGKDEEDGGDDSADAETESDRESGSEDEEDKKKDDEDDSHRRGGRKRGRGAEAGQEHHAMPEGLGDPHVHHQ